MRGLTVSSQWTALLPGFSAPGAGGAMATPPLASTAIGVVPPQRSGMASGINSTFRQVGVATGIAVLGAIFESSIRSTLAPKLGATPIAERTAQIAHAVAGGGSQQVLRAVPAAQRGRVEVAIHAAFVSAMNDILLVGGLIAFVGAALGLALVRGRDFVTYGAPEPATAPPPAE